MGKYLVLYNLDTCVASEYILAVLDGGGGAYVDAYRCVELQRVTSGSRFGGPNIWPILSRSWLMNIQVVLVRDMVGELTHGL